AMNEATVWVVLARNMSHIVDEKAFAAMVLDQGTGLIRGLAVAPTQGGALRAAMTKALTEPAEELPPDVPSLVLCSGLQTAPVTQQLTKLLSKDEVPPIRSRDIDEAEDVFDSMAGRLAGREQPWEFAKPDAWRALMAATAHYARAQPWVRWP